MRVRFSVLALAIIATTVPARAAPKRMTVTLVAYDSFATTKGIFDGFTKRTGISVKVLTGGDGGELVNKAILTKDRPLGDVLWGVDNTFLSRAVREGIFTPYTARGLRDIDPKLRAIVPSFAATPVDYGDVCVNYDKNGYIKRGKTPPATFDDLTKAAYKGQLVVENPATSSPGLAFLLATIAKYGERGPNNWQAYWKRLEANGVKVVNGWSEAYNTEFSGSAGGGKRPLVVSYGSSPPAAVLFGPDPKATVAPIGVIDQTCFRQVEFAGILAHTKNLAAAKMLIDFLISPEFQRDLALNMFVYPANRTVALPEIFTRFSAAPASPYSIPATRIAQSREKWIDEWSAILL